MCKITSPFWWCLLYFLHVGLHSIVLWLRVFFKLVLLAFHFLCISVFPIPENRRKTLEWPDKQNPSSFGRAKIVTRFNVNRLSLPFLPPVRLSALELTGCFFTQRRYANPAGCPPSTPPLSHFTEILSWESTSGADGIADWEGAQVFPASHPQAPEVTSKALNPRWPDQKIVSTLMTEIETFIRFSYKTWKGTKMKNTHLFRWCIKKKIQVNFSRVLYSIHVTLFCINYGNDSGYICIACIKTEKFHLICFVTSHPKAQSIV